MDIQQLRYIIALSQELNFNRAAQRVGISQPTLSQQIQKLEDELGEALFERSTKSVRITPAGELFLPHAQAALDTLKAGVNELKEGQTGVAGTIRLAFIPTIGPYILPRVLKIIQKEAPKLKLKLFEETTSVLTENLKRAKFDLGLLALPIEDSGIAAQSFGREEFLLAVHAKHPLVARKFITVQDIAKEKLIMLQEGHCFRDQALEFCSMRRDNDQLVFEGSSLVSVLNLVAAGEGVTLVPKMVQQGSIPRDVKFIPFKGHKPSRELGLIWRMSSPLGRAEKFLIDAIRRAIIL